MKTQFRIIAALAVAIAAMTAPARAEEPSATPQATQPAITRQEYEQLLRTQEQMRQEIERLKAGRAAPATQPSASPALAPGKEPALVEDIDDLDKRLKIVADEAHAGLPGIEHLVIAGDCAVGFSTQNKSPSSFSTNFSPLFLFAPTDNLLFEAGLGFGVSTDGTNSASTDVELSLADASVIINDNLIVGGGLFAVPFGQYHNHFDPPWINRLPDDPIIFTDNTAPVSEVGLFAKGVYPVKCVGKLLPDAKFTYDLYIANGPNLITNDPSAAGQLNFADYTDLNNGKAAGGRIALLPSSNIELGYSMQYSHTSPGGFPHVHALLQAVDLNWVQEYRPLGGVFTTRAEWIWSQIEPATYDPTGAQGFGPIRVGNWTQGGYCTLSYRPTLSRNKWLQNTEYVFRYDTERSPLSSPGGEHESRYTLGVDYWITPSWVMKVAYEFDNRKVGVEQSAFYVQLGLGL
jgi:hypothetical protein